MTEDKWLNMQVDSQILTSFMSCPREMNWKYNKHLHSIEGTKAAWEEGTLVHEGMKGYYSAKKDGLSYSDCVDVGLKFAKKCAPTLDNVKAESVLYIYESLKEYFDFRKNDSFVVLAVEHPFQFIAYEKYPLRVILTGRIDLITKDLQSNMIIPYDHKKELEAYFYSSLSNQFKIYCLATNANLLVVNRFGLQKSYKVDKKFARENLNFDSDCLSEFKDEVLPYYAGKMLEAMDSNYYPPNYASCAGSRIKFACQFSDKYNNGICSVSREVRDIKLMKYFVEKPEWDPLLEV